MKLSISANFPEVQRALESLQEDIRARALASAVNKTVTQAKTAMSKEIRQEFNISASKVNAALIVKRASFKSGTFGIEASLESPTKKGRSLNLINFDARKVATGVSFRIKKGGARKIIKGAFIGNGGRTVFIRKGKSRLPIEAVQTIGVAQMFNTKRINARVVQFMRDKFPDIFEHEAQHYLDVFNRR